MNEECDDFNLEDKDGCSSNCMIEEGWKCPENKCEPICGDGIKITEECDDKNDFNDDGCSGTCVIEEGWTCPEGSSCTPICGDSLIKGFEECDDGNKV